MVIQLNYLLYPKIIDIFITKIYSYNVEISIYQGGLRIRVLWILLVVSILYLSASISVSAFSSKYIETIKAEDVLEQIEVGKTIEYDNVAIEGDLNLSGVSLPSKYKERSGFQKTVHYLSNEVKPIDSTIHIKNSEIYDNVYSNNIIFNKSVSFDNCIFNQDVQFRGTQFTSDASFANSKFTDNAYFEWAEFDKTADFQNAIFKNSTHFLEANFLGASIFKNTSFQQFLDIRGAKFRGLANFALSTFYNDTYFNQILFSDDADFKTSKFYGLSTFWAASFEDSADFRATKFYKDVTFSNSQFKGTARFTEGRFYGIVDFRKSTFSNDSLLWNAVFDGKVDFKDAIFEKNVDFEDATFKNNADFSYVQFSNNRNYIAKFLNTSFIGNVTFAYASFSPLVDMRRSHFYALFNMTQAIFDRLEIKWSDIEENLVCDDSVYISLINNFENLGQFKDADNCAYQYGKYRLENSGSMSSKVMETLSWITCGFGVRPQYAIIWTIILTFSFGVLYYFSNALQKDSRIKRVLNAGIYDKNPKGPTFHEALYFSLTVFLVSLPPHGLHPSDRWRYIVMFEDILGWIIMTLFVVALGHVMIR